MQEYLAEYMIQRKVDSQGKISVYNTPRFAGRGFMRLPVYIHLDPVEVRCVMLNEAGQEMRRVDLVRKSSKSLEESRVTVVRLVARAETLLERKHGNCFSEALMAYSVLSTSPSG